MSEGLLQYEGVDELVIEDLEDEAIQDVFPLPDLGRLAIAPPIEEDPDYTRHHVLLEREQEVALAKRIEAGVFAEEALNDPEKLRETAGRHADVPKEQLGRELLWVAQDGRIAAEYLLNANFRLVQTVANTFTRTRLENSDLVQIGQLGLMRAMHKHRHELGTKFSTYAVPWIHQKISRELDDTEEIVRLPVHREADLRRIRNADIALVNELGRDPTLTELLEELEMDESDYHKVVAAGRIQRVKPLDAPANPWVSDKETAGDLLTNTVQDVDPKRDMVLALNGSALTTEQLEIVKLRYGFMGKPQSFANIVKATGIKMPQVRIYEATALEVLRNDPDFRAWFT